MSDAQSRQRYTLDKDQQSRLPSYHTDTLELTSPASYNRQPTTNDSSDLKVLESRVIVPRRMAHSESRSRHR